MLSYGLTGAPQPGQCDPGLTSDSPAWNPVGHNVEEAAYDEPDQAAGEDLGRGRHRFGTLPGTAAGSGRPYLTISRQVF